MKNFKKMALSFGSISMLAAPVVTLACGPATYAKYDTNNDGKLTLFATVTQSGRQYQSLEKIIAKYNDLEKNAENFMPVELTHREGGYGSIPSGLLNNFRARDKSSQVPNMILDYPESVGSTSYAKMHLDFYSPVDEENGVSDEDAFLDNFDSTYASVNNRIGGLDLGAYFVPISKSTEMLSLNSPLLYWLITKAGGTFSSTISGVTDPITFELMADGQTSDDFSQEQDSQHGWTLNTSYNTDDILLNIDDDVFTKHENLFNLSNALAEAFNLGAGSTKRIFGIDAPANLFYTLAFGKGGYEDEDFIFSKNPTTGRINYDLFTNGHQKQASAKAALQMISDSISGGGLSIYGGGSYGSDYLKSHNLAINIGSTAGYVYNFATGDIPEFDLGAGDYTAFTSNTDLVASENQVDGMEHADPDHLGYFSTFTSSVWKSTTDDSKVSGFDVKLLNTTADSAFENAIVDIDGAASQKHYLSSHSQASDVVGTTQATDGTFPKYLIATDRVISQDSTLQEVEAVFTKPPTSVNISDTEEVVFSQGPGIIGVHNNEPENLATFQFLKWFSDTTLAIDWSNEGGALTPESPLKFWADAAGYLVPLKNEIIGNQVEGNIIAFETLDYVSNPHVNHLEVPIDSYARAMRSIVEEQLTVFYNIYNNGSGISMDAIYDKLLSEARAKKVV